MKYTKKALALLVFPIIIIAAAYLTAVKSDGFTPQVRLAVSYFPYFLFLIAALLGLWFNRSKIFFTSLILALAQFILSWQGPEGIDKVFFSNTAFTFASILLPINILFFSTASDRGVNSAWGKRRLLAVGAQVLMVVWVIWYNDVDFLQLLNMDFFKVEDKILAPFSQLSLILFLFAFLKLFFKTARTGNSSFGGSNSILLIAFFALFFKATPMVLPIFFAAIGLLLDKEVVQVSYNMAYLDELTGLPSRRALKEQLVRLSGKYCIAMVDIDHFKKFNDTYGHDVGDQVLKLVGSCIKGINGGGKFYRYGGEEFTVIFPGKSVEEAMPYLEELRKNIAERAFLIRGKNRPKKKPKDVLPNTEASGQLTVTVSIGAAEKTERLKTADDVIKSADRALYKAKESGRNCVYR